MSSKKIPESEEHFRNLYRTMKKAGLSKDFLQSNSATHSFLLGAMAEIIDNAKDADSTHLDIGMESFNGKDALTFLDNGKGMNPEELNNVIKIGYMQKDDRKVGRYGNGLKAGSMRLAHECLVLTKKQPAEGSPGSRSALLLSRSFLEKNGLDEVHVAMPSFELDSDKPLVGDDDEVHGADEVLHNTETEVIASYCGLKDMAQLFTLFDRIKVQGTLVILFNLRREVTGEPELNWTTDPEDIWTRDPENTPLERTSLREYLRMLYYEPTMTVNLRGRPVLLQRPVSELYMANAYPWKPRNMQHAKDIEIKRRQEVVDKMKEDHNVLKEEYGKLLSTPVSSEAERRENEKKRRLLGDRIADRDKEIAEADEQLRSKQKATVEERIYCGFYPYKRKIAGALIYINGRLVEAVPFLDCQKKNPELLKGLTTVVNLSIKVLIPTTNKQGLESTKDRATLLKAMNETMRYHFDEVILKQLGKEPGKFLFEMWQSFGCPTDDAVFEQKRDKPTLEAIHRSVGHTVLCRNCLQWKRLPTSLYTSLLSNEENIVGWKCQLHPNTSKRSCGIPDTNLDPAMKTLIPLTARREPRPPTSSLSFRPSTSAQSDANEQKPETEALNRLSEMFTIPKKSRDRPISSIVPARVLDHVRPKAAPPDTTKVSPAVPPRISPRKVRVIEEEEEVLEVPPRRHVPVPWNGSARNRIVETEEVAPGVSRKGARAGRPSLTKKAVVIEEEEEEPEPMVETPSQRSNRRNGDSLHRVVEEEEVPETSRRSTRTPSKKRHVVEEDDEEEILEIPQKRRINGVVNRGEENKVPMMDDGDTSQEIVHGVTSFELEMMLSQLVNHGVPKSWGRRKFRTMTEDYADLAKACSQEASRRA